MLLENVLYMEFHDAKIECISILSGGKVRVEFKNISSFHGKDLNFSEVWNSTAIVEFCGVSHMEVNGIIAESDYVGHGDLFDEQGEEIPLLPVNSLKNAASFRLLMVGSGTTIALSLERAVLVSLVPQRKLENWTH